VLRRSIRYFTSLVHFATTILLALTLAEPPATAAQPFHDKTHPSAVFGQDRNYRIFLPRDYEAGSKSYPVIYYFHGHSDRYTLEHYDQGKDTVPKIAAFVASHDVIVISVDGYVASDYTGFYGGAPWGIYEESTGVDFGPYFVELVTHIDRTYRTFTDRRHRATSGLSMGGYMSLYLSARYPELIGSASAFNPGPEFFTGEKGRRILWRPKDHTALHANTMVRLVRASGDYISQYHEETREAYARDPSVRFEYRQDEYHKHAATSIAETFDFHMRAFSESALDNVPERWSYTSAHRNGSAWGWQFSVESVQAGLTYIENASQCGLRVRTRQWAPDGPPVAGSVSITTAPLYAANERYRIIDLNLRTGKTTTSEATADREGRLRLTFDGAGHQVGINGPGTGAQPPVVLPLVPNDRLRVQPGVATALPVRIFNPRAQPMRNVQVELATEYPTVELQAAKATVEEIAPGQAVDLSDRLRAHFTGGGGYFAHARLTLALTYDGWHTESQDLDLFIAPARVPAPSAIEILDGRSLKLSVFRQRGNQGGGGSIERVVKEGKGNGNGVLEPGEEATIWVKLEQGLDPFDKNNWYRAKIYSDSPHLAEVADLQEQKQREWTGAKERTSVVRLSPDTPAGTVIPLLLDNESWSYHFTPDMRYGTEKLYQAFQLHTRHLHRHELKVALSQ
jgi:predicted alpha/beta superfamily hydrolase